MGLFYLDGHPSHVLLHDAHDLRLERFAGCGRRLRGHGACCLLLGGPAGGPRGGRQHRLLANVRRGTYRGATAPRDCLLSLLFRSILKREKTRRQREKRPGVCTPQPSQGRT